MIFWTRRNETKAEGETRFETSVPMFTPTNGCASWSCTFTCLICGVDLACKSVDSSVNKDKMMVSLETAIVEERLELHFLIPWFWFSYRSLHYLASFFLLGLICGCGIVGDVGSSLWYLGFGSV